MSLSDRLHAQIELSAADTAALDALIAAGMDVGRVAPEHRVRAEAIVRVLGLLDALPVATSDGGAKSPDGLIGAVKARIAEAAQPVAEESEPHGWISDHSGLIDDDIEALEALIGAGYDPKRVPSVLRHRAEHQARLLSLLASPLADETGPEARRREEALVRRTQEAMQSADARQAVRMNFESVKARRGLRLMDLVSVAAVLLIGSIVVLPVFASIRDSRLRAACSSNFATAGLGFGMYAGDYKESLPMASASLAGSRWWEVGKSREESNSANLYTLAKAAYVQSLEPLACPASEQAPRGKCKEDSFDWCNLEEVSYSYQNLFSHSRPTWGGKAQMRQVILADRSPITLSSVRKQRQNPFANSPNHGGRGQTVLFNDGSSQWTRDPVMGGGGGDNIWLPQMIELGIKAAEWSARTGQPVILIGREEPGAPGNVFLGP